MIKKHEQKKKIHENINHSLGNSEGKQLVKFSPLFSHVQILFIVHMLLLSFKNVLI